MVVETIWDSSGEIFFRIGNFVSYTIKASGGLQDAHSRGKKEK